MDEQFHPVTEQEVAEYDRLVSLQKAEEARNAKNGQFIFWFIVALFSAAAVAAALAERF